MFVVILFLVIDYSFITYKTIIRIFNAKKNQTKTKKNSLHAGKQENLPPRSVKDRLGIPQIVPPNSNKVLNLVQPKAETKPEEPDDAKQQKNVETVKEDKKAQVAAAIKKNQELLAAKEKRKKNQEEALKVSQNLRKRQQELLEKQLAQQKLLIGKMEKSNIILMQNYRD